LGGPEGRLLLQGKTGSLFGTGSGASGGNGQVFKLTSSNGSWKETTLLKFNGSDGSIPLAGLIENSTGALFGTAGGGGSSADGVVFQLSKSGNKWVETVLHSFSGGSDGAEPTSDLVMDKDGALYGTTYMGGESSAGTVFVLTESGGIWKEKILHSFTNGGDGNYPQSGLYRSSAGDLYGTTTAGGAYGEGTVFELTQSGGKWTETVLYSFEGGSDGAQPEGVLVQGSKGIFYGTTSEGGAGGVGAVFKLSQSNGVWTESVIYSFKNNGSDGADPSSGLCWIGNALYGTTYAGGADNAGTVYQLSQSKGVWNETQLYAFGGEYDGSNPVAGLIVDSTGALYGTTWFGGRYGWGTVYEIVP
jgi:uncharacterized repeat protein (TIGR03803 family)